MTEETKYKCRKCGKAKPLREMIEVEGEKYCCRACCGDVASGEHKQTKKNICEYC